MKRLSRRQLLLAFLAGLFGPWVNHLFGELAAPAAPPVPEPVPVSELGTSYHCKAIPAQLARQTTCSYDALGRLSAVVDGPPLADGWLPQPPPASKHD